MDWFGNSRGIMTVNNQIENRNFLTPVGFKFVLQRSPKVAFFCNQANIPSMNMGNAVLPSYLRQLPIPGDEIEFENLNIRFLVDEDLKNYMEIFNWIRGIGTAESLSEFDRLEASSTIQRISGHNIFSDGTLHVLNNNLLSNFKVVFADLFPVSLTTLNFDATDTTNEYFTAEVSFKYTIYNLYDMEDNRLC